MSFFAPSSSTTKRRVLQTAELERVVKLRRRFWTPEQAAEFAEKLSKLLRTQHGQMGLRSVQAVALYELAEVGGLFGPQRCGAGKTLVSFLAPSVLQRVKGVGYRPLLLVPGGLLEKTERDMRTLAEHWQIAPFIRLMSYEWLGRVQAAEALNEYQADLLILDECHRAKNTGASSVRRLSRWLREREKSGARVHVAAFSGTVTKRSLHDFAHILRWCLPGSQCPLPMHFQDLLDWADALDEKRQTDDRAQARTEPGALRLLCNEDENALWEQGSELRAARMGWRRRLVDTPGVVATHESPIDATLTVRTVRPVVPEIMSAAFEHLRNEWETPDGWPVADALAKRRHARELALGFFYKWEPRPPQEWLEPRRVWAKFVRETIQHSRKLDSELQVRNFVASHRERQAEGAHLKEHEIEALAKLDAWLAVRDTFEPNTVPVWMDDSVLQFIADWAEHRKGIIWVEHTCVGQRLERDFGLAYYGQQGRDAQNRFIDDHPKNESLVASIGSNKEGRNLQGWAENLIVGIPSAGSVNEQLISRTHRDGQEAEEVTVEVLVSCFEHLEALDRARDDADYIQTSTGSPQKLMLAGYDMDPKTLSGVGPRWRS